MEAVVELVVDGVAPVQRHGGEAGERVQMGPGHRQLGGVGHAQAQAQDALVVGVVGLGEVR